MGMGDYESPIPNLVAFASMLACGIIAGTLASLICLGMCRESSPRNEVKEDHGRDPP